MSTQTRYCYRLHFTDGQLTQEGHSTRDTEGRAISRWFGVGREIFFITLCVALLYRLVCLDEV